MGARVSMLARDLMQMEVLTVRESDSLDDLCDLLVQAHIHGAPVVADDGQLVGFISLEDVLYGRMTRPSESYRRGPKRREKTEEHVPKVREIMTSPAVSATEDTHVSDLCRIMWRLRLHHIPVVRDGKVTGIVSTLDLCRAIADGEIAV